MHEIVDIYVYIENCERERERPVWGSQSSTWGAWVVKWTIYELRCLSVSGRGKCRAFSVSLRVRVRVRVRGRSGGWGKRLRSKLGIGHCGGVVLGVIGRVLCASVDGDRCSFERMVEIVWCHFVLLPQFHLHPWTYSLSFFVNLESKGNHCSTTNCTGVVLLSY